MQSIQKKSKFNKKLYLGIVLVLIIAGFTAWYFIVYSASNTAEDSTKPPTKEEVESEKQTGIDDKQKIGNETAEENNSPSKGATSQDPSTNERIDITTEVTSASVIISSKIYGLAEGTCTLSISSNEGNFEEKVDILYQPSFSTCAGFEVPFTKLKKGSWHIILTAIDSNNQTARVTKDLSL